MYIHWYIKKGTKKRKKGPTKGAENVFFCADSDVGHVMTLIGNTKQKKSNAENAEFFSFNVMTTKT